MAYPSPTSKSNSASRLYRLFYSALRANRQKSAADAWAEALELPTDLDGLERTHQLNDLLQDCIRELRRMTTDLKVAGVPDALLSHYVTHPEHALLPTNANATWEPTRAQYLPDDVMLSFAWYSHVLGDDGQAASREDLQELEALLRSLEQALLAPGLPPDLVDLLRKHCTAMQRAVRASPVAGIEPLRDSARSLVADITIDKDDILSSARRAEKSAVGKVGSALGEVWKKAVEVAGDSEKMAKAGVALLEFVDTAVKHIK